MRFSTGKKLDGLLAVILIKDQFAEHACINNNDF
jgi:hypothetical protein